MEAASSAMGAILPSQSNAAAAAPPFPLEERGGKLRREPACIAIDGENVGSAGDSIASMEKVQARRCAARASTRKIIGDGNAAWVNEECGGTCLYFF